MANQFDKTIGFADWVRHLRYWLAMRNVPDRENIRIEVTFPNGRSQHYALASLAQELTPLMATAAATQGILSGGQFEFEGVKITFSNPERWDRRRA